MNDSAIEPPKVIAAIVCDFNRTAIGTRSRLADLIAGKPLLHHVLDRVSKITGLSAIALLIPEDQMNKADGLQSVGAGSVPIHIMPLTPRSDAVSARIRAARQWNLHAWRGGAGQYTCFDEEYHPVAIARAAEQLQADHVLVVHSHSLFLDMGITSALVHHHLHKNHEMRVTYTPCAPGISGMILQAGIVKEMAEKNAFPWQLLAYDPTTPTFDTLIREACMQVDPALSKIPNRFCLDTDRSWTMARQLLGQTDKETRRQGDKEKDLASPGLPVPLSPCPLVPLSASSLALAAAHTIAPGVKDFRNVHPFPRELEIELTARRLTSPSGSVPALVRESRGQLDPQHWQRWLAAQKFCDDLLLTFAGDGDPLLYPQLSEILRAARNAHVMAICVQTDLACENIDPLLAAIQDDLLDVLSVTMYGHTAPTYNKVANAGDIDLHKIVARNLTTLAPIIAARGGVPLVVPRLLEVRETIPEMEPFFDAWIQQAGWAVIDYPTDRAGQIPFAGVIDMAPPKRRPCRRLWDRMLLRANGAAVACDQDMLDKLALGNIESHTLEQLWIGDAFKTLRTQHADAQWNKINPCNNCREWHRA